MERNIKRLSAHLRFIRKINIVDRCWIWSGAKNKKGYGRFMFKGKNRKAHHVSLFLFKNIADGFSKHRQVDHLCNNTSCVNPDHLEIVNQNENVRRRYAKFYQKSHRLAQF